MNIKRREAILQAFLQVTRNKRMTVKEIARETKIPEWSLYGFKRGNGVLGGDYLLALEEFLVKREYLAPATSAAPDSVSETAPTYRPSSITDFFAMELRTLASFLDRGDYTEEFRIARYKEELQRLLQQAEARMNGQHKGD